jgi:hypothetical protein
MRRAGLVLMLLALPLVTACGTRAKVSSALVSDAATKTLDAKTSRYAVTFSMDFGDQEVSFGGGGVYDYENDRGVISIDFSPLAGISGDSMGNGKFEVRFDGLVYYMKLPRGMEGAEGLPLGKWLKIDLAKVSRFSGIDLGAMMQTEQNPARLLRFLRSTGADVTEVGEETVRDVSTTRYRTRVDLQRLVGAGGELGDMPKEMRRQMRAEIKKLQKETGMSEIPVNVWLDSGGVLRRMTMEYEFDTDGEKASFLTTVELYDFGVPVRVSAPPAGETVDLTGELMP